MHTVAGALALAAMALVGAQSSQQADADQKELSAYRLTKDGLDRYMTTLRALASELSKDPRFKEMAALRAEVERLQAKDEQTDAEAARVESLLKQVEALDEATDISALISEPTLSDIEANIGKHPAFARAIRAGGLTPRGFAKFTVVLFQASLAAGLQKAGLLKELPEGLASENLKFVIEHEKELQRMQEQMGALTPGGKER